MARDLKLDITSDSAGARRGLDETARGADRLADNARQLGRAFTTASGAAVVLGREVDKAGDQARRSGAELARVAREVDNIGDQARQSARAVDHLGDELGRVGRKGLLAGATTGGAGALVGAFEGIAPVAAKAGAESASTFASAFEGGILSAFQALPSEAKAAILAGVGGTLVAVAPFLAATVSAAVIGGVGAGGLVGGIVLAARDPKVKDAFKAFGGTALDVLTDASRSFVAPLVEAAQTFTGAFKGSDIAGPLKETFEALSTAVAPLARGLVGLVRNALPGLRDAAKAAAPLFQALADEMPKIGAAVSSFFGSIARGKDGAVDALKTILFFLEATLVIFGRLIEDAAELYEALYRVSGNEAFDRIVKGGTAVGQVMGQATDATDAAAGAFDAAAAAADGYKDALDRVFNEANGLIDSTIGYKQALADLTEQLKAHKGQWDLNTQAGRDNARAFEDAVRQAYAMRQAQIDSEGPSAAADDAFRKQVATLVGLARAAGASQAQIDFLTQAWLNLLNQPSEKTFTVRVRQSGSVSAAGVESGGEIRSSGGRAIARAAGGPVWPGQLFKVGERKPEYLSFDRPGMVYPTLAGAQRVAARAAGPAATQAQPVTLHVTGDSRSWLYQTIMYGIQTGQLQLT